MTARAARTANASSMPSWEAGARALLGVLGRPRRARNAQALYWASMRRTPLPSLSIALSLSLALALAFTFGAARAGSRDRRFFSARHGVGIEAPTGWTLSQHTGYPEIIVVLLHPDGSRISVSVAPTKAADAQALADQSRKGLEAQHLSIERVGAGPRGSVQLEAKNAARASELRQLYFVRAIGGGKRQAVVLTLVAPSDALALAAPAFDWTAAHATFETPTGAAEPPDAGARER
jgi:hypothetical protein